MKPNTKKSQRGRARGRGHVLRRTKRHTAVGRIFPPVDVRNKGGLNELLKRIKTGPITIMLVYADWCGHCKNFQPHFDAAARTPNRTAQAVKVSDEMVDEVNNAIQSMNAAASPLAVQAYPTVLLLDNKGNSITEVNAVNSTPVMTNLMKEAGQNAEEVALSSPKAPSGSKAPSSLNVLAEESASMNMGRRSANRSLPTDPTMDEMGSLPRVVSTKSQSAEEVAGNTVEPPVNSEDLINNNEGTEMATQKGGSLYAAMASSAYRLAPAAVLLGMAGVGAATMRRKRSARKTLRRRGRR